MDLPINDDELALIVMSLKKIEKRLKNSNDKYNKLLEAWGLDKDGDYPPSHDLEKPLTDEKRLNYYNIRPLSEKLKLVKKVRDENPDGPYKKILREQHGMVI